MSDIVISSLKGVTPACAALAERFREAIERKRRERVNAVKGVVYSQVHHGHGQQHYCHGKSKTDGAGSGGGGVDQGKEGQHFIRVEDVLRAEKENRARVKAAKATTAAAALSAPSDKSSTVQTPNTPATPAMPSVSSPPPSDSASEQTR